MFHDFIGGSAQVREAVAALIEADRAEILAAYVRGLEHVDSPLVCGAASREQAIANGTQVLADVTQSLRAGRVQLTEGADAGSRQLFMIALLALNQSVNSKVTEMTAAYAGYLLGKVHDAHVAERRRIARELHDRIGNVLSVAYRRLEVYPLHQDEGRGAVETAQRSILESMESLRAVTSELRLCEPIENLEKALATYLQSAPAGEVDVSLRVDGEETWAPPAVRDESFFVIREAIRNALTHARAATVLVSVHITEAELLACVRDDGCGFEPSERSPSSGLGLLSMRERAALMGGNLTISSKRYRGTVVELLVPLSGYRNDATK